MERKSLTAKRNWRVLDNLALFIRLVLDGRIPQRHVAKCFERYFDVDLYEDGPDFDKWYGTNFNRLLG